MLAIAEESRRSAQGSLCKKVVLEVTVAGQRPRPCLQDAGQVPRALGMSAGLAPGILRTDGNGFSVVEGILFSLRTS